MSENHPAWKAYIHQQSQFSYPKSVSKGKRRPSPYDQDNVEQEVLRVTEGYAHDMGMIKDILVVMMNLMEKQNKSIGELYALLEENTDMIDLLIAGEDYGD